MTSLPRSLKRVAVLGLGKAGGSLVASFTQAHVDVACSARRLPALTGSLKRAQPSALFLAVPDDVIDEVAAALARRPDLVPPLVVHVSGVHGRSALGALSSLCAVGTFHPLASLDGSHAVPPGTLIAVDASTRPALTVLTALAKRIGAHPAHVADEKRAIYHAGAVVAGNLPIALVKRGMELLVDAGVPEKLARQSLARLLMSAAHNAVEKPLAHALTGPIARGDADTVRRHLDALDVNWGPLASVYRELSLILVNDVAALRPRVARAMSAEINRPRKRQRPRDQRP